MSGSNNYATGVNEQLYITEESVYGTYVAPAGTDAARVKEIGFELKAERVWREDKFATRDRTERISRKRSGAWTISSYLLPSGTAGTEPDTHLLFKHMFGASATTASSVDYTLLRDQTGSVNLHRICEHFAESVTGVVPNQMVIKWAGNDEPSVEFTGFGKDYIRTGYGTMSASGTLGDATVTVTDGSDLFYENSMVKFTDATSGTVYSNSGNGYTVTADPTGSTVAISPVLEANLVTASIIQAFFPAASVSDSVITSIVGSLSVGGTTYDCTEGTITLGGNMKARDDIFGEATSIGYSVSGYREVAFTFTTFVPPAYVKDCFAAKTFTNKSIVITLGDTAGAQCLITLPYSELDIIPISVPTNEEATISWVGVCKGTGSEDSITLSML